MKKNIIKKIFIKISKILGFELIDQNQFISTTLNKELDLRKLPKIEKNVIIGACVSNPEKFIGIGLNYIDHAEETGIKPPAEPIIFFKANSCISGPHDNVLIPKNSKTLERKI